MDVCKLVLEYCFGESNIVLVNEISGDFYLLGTVDM